MLDAAVGLLFRYHGLSLVVIAAMLIAAAELGNRNGLRVQQRADGRQ